MRYDRKVRWMGLLAAACAVQWACGGGDARSDEGGADAAGMSGDAARRVEVTGCVERGIIPGSYMLTAVRMAGHGTASAETRGTSGAAENGRASAVGEPRSEAHGQAASATSDSYTLRALDGADLGDLVGRRVMVQGQLQANQAYEGGAVGTSGDRGGQADPSLGTAAERPGGSMAAAGASMPLQQLAAENIEPLDGSCGTGGEAETGGDAEPRSR